MNLTGYSFNINKQWSQQANSSINMREYSQQCDYIIDHI